MSNWLWRYGRFVCVTIIFLLVLPGCSRDAAEDPAADVGRTAVPETAVIRTPTTTPSAVSAATLSATLSAPDQVEAPPTVTRKPAATSAASSPEAPGALMQISMQSQVGILLDDFPADMRDEVAAELLELPEAAWLERAMRQIRLTRSRLTFRHFAYAGKGQLPLPPAALWQIELDPAGPERQTIQEHDLLVMGYTFTTMLLTDAASPGEAEPALADVGGTWEEPFVFPIDPDLLLQRTGNACVNEGGYPPNSFDSENVWHFYDYTCTADSSGAAGCHRTYRPELSCWEALAAWVGHVETSLRFERLDWDAAAADGVRVGEVTSEAAADLTAVAADLATNRIIYRYFEPEDCALAEGAVGSAGWRRLLQFDATVWNVGNRPLHIGPATTEDPINRVFIYDSCHDHFHYSNYGDFFIQDQGALTGSKQAFCVQSTVRMSNHEVSPLTHEYSCRFQGIQVGWADEYIAGLDAQWVDITDLEVPSEGVTIQLGFTSNGYQFLCEGTPVLDENGVQLWEPSEFTTPDGHGINRPQCDFIENWSENNEALAEVFVPSVGSFVTEPCTNGELGPRRNCGFAPVEVDEDEAVCEPGTAVEQALSDDLTYPLVARVCERSAALGVGVACTYEDAVVNQVMMDASELVAFSCPQVRDGEEFGGGYAVYVAGVR